MAMASTKHFGHRGMTGLTSNKVYRIILGGTPGSRDREGRGSPFPSLTLTLTLVAPTVALER